MVRVDKEDFPAKCMPVWAAHHWIQKLDILDKDEGSSQIENM